MSIYTQSIHIQHEHFPRLTTYQALEWKINMKEKTNKLDTVAL